MTLTVNSLTRAEAARIMRALDDVRDDSYLRETPLGPPIAAYLDYALIEEGLSEQSITNREPVYRKFALEHADLGLDAFGCRDGVPLVRAFLARNWGSDSVDTRKTRTSNMRALFSYWFTEGLIAFDPMRAIKSPKGRGKRRNRHPWETISRIILAQPRECDRFGVELMGRHGLRKTELRLCQLGHFDFAAGVMYVFGKGAKERTVELFPDVAARLEAYCRTRALTSRDWRTEFLIYWHKVGRRGSWPFYTVDVIAEDRARPLSNAGFDTWWDRCTDRAGVERFPMHELRHSAATAFQLAHNDYEATRQFLGHENIATTAAYVHVPSEHLRAAVRATPNPWDEVS